MHAATTSIEVTPILHLIQSKVLYRISGCEDRVILLDVEGDRQKQLHRPNFCSEADLLYGYVLRNPNKTISRQEICEGVGKTLRRDLSSIVSGMKFSGILRRLFFRVSKANILFYNPITLERMQGMMIAPEALEPFFDSTR